MLTTVVDSDSGRWGYLTLQATLFLVGFDQGVESYYHRVIRFGKKDNTNVFELTYAPSDDAPGPCHR